MTMSVASEVFHMTTLRFSTFPLTSSKRQDPENPRIWKHRKNIVLNRTIYTKNKVEGKKKKIQLRL